ncbi:thermonuclease family protein [Myxosarcina sp. GI1]|uniref:thermonuclease family protein n=1 Tax=Myxosarcina sp. GI1 TaxID=1541065 RepID=UPI001C11D7F8|nr:thermonuclease family protein [Myxosarcina sp. GI1]
MNPVDILKRVFLIIIFSTLLLSCSLKPTNSNLISAKVERIVSGQTLEVVAIAPENSSQTTKVRIIGIDAPDLRQSPWGAAAKQRLTELIADETVQLELEERNTDSFDRLLAHVWHNNISVGEQLVKEGYVLANTSYSHKYSQRFLNAREYARLLGYGIWNPQQPLRQTPSQFRSQYSPS